MLIKEILTFTLTRYKEIDIIQTDVIFGISFFKKPEIHVSYISENIKVENLKQTSKVL